jgi:hypothetical protein
MCMQYSNVSPLPSLNAVCFKPISILQASSSVDWRQLVSDDSLATTATHALWWWLRMYRLIVSHVIRDASALGWGGGKGRCRPPNGETDSARRLILEAASRTDPLA